MKKINKETLKNVLADYRLNVADFEVIHRDFSLDDFGNYVLVGIRRAGKSFLLYQKMQQLIASGTSLDQLLYLNFEDERLIGMSAEELNLLLEIHWEIFNQKPILFLDEIQNIEGWEKFARRLADQKHQVYITGSNAKMLSKDIQTTLGGRYLVKEVYPYSFKEYLRANGIDFSDKELFSTKGKASVLRSFNDYFYFGGFPESAFLQNKRDYLSSIYQKIFLGDIAMRYSVENTFALKVLMKKLAESIKQPLSFNRMKNIVVSTGTKVSINTIINYVEYAKDAWLILPVQNFVDKLAAKESNLKYYFIDNGILNLFLLDGNTSLLENIVAVQLLRIYGREDAVFFYNSNIEVDFYIPEKELAIQVCYNMSDAETAQREIKALMQIEKFLPVKERLIITKEQEDELVIDDKKIRVIPVWKWLLEAEI